MNTLIEIKNFSSEEDKKNKILKLKFIGELDETNTDETFKKIYKQVNDKKEVIFDFSQLTYLNSKSIGYLADIYGNIVDDNGNLFKLINVSEGVFDILELVGLTSIMNISK